MERARISIVTPSLNQGRFVERTLASVLGQRYPRLEFILMDGGSTDGTAELLRRYRRHFAYLESTPEVGPTTPVQRGLARAGGEILAVLGMGEMLAPSTLDFVTWYFAEHPRVDMIYSHRLLVDEADRVIGHVLLPPHRHRNMRRHPLIPPETAFFRRGLYEQAGGVDPAMQAISNFELYLRFMAIGKLARADRFLAAHRVLPTSRATHRMEAVGAEELTQLRAELPRGPWQEFQDWRLIQSIVWRSDRFVRSGRTKPGAWPGMGYSYDEIWAGTLSNPRDGGV
ncbi:MAG TPA: glycosyltransferase [Aliidongia sp.]|nr:glycosyltransferase [Aliidongia sp.]